MAGRATELTRRMLGNIETVVQGKHEEVALVLAALTCDGHVLLETRGGGEPDSRGEGEPSPQHLSYRGARTKPTSRATRRESPFGHAFRSTRPPGDAVILW